MHSSSELNAPCTLPSMTLTVSPDWIDLYGHMNAANYVFVFDRNGFELFERFDIGENYTRNSGCGLYTVEIQTRYLRELLVDTQLSLRLRFLSSDDKRMHCLFELFNVDAGYLAATMEQISLHVDLQTRKVTPFPPDVQDRLQAAVLAHSEYPLPVGFEPKLTMRRKA